MRRGGLAGQPFLKPFQVYPDGDQLWFWYFPPVSLLAPRRIDRSAQKLAAGPSG